MGIILKQTETNQTQMKTSTYLLAASIATLTNGTDTALPSLNGDPDSITVSGW